MNRSNYPLDDIPLKTLRIYVAVVDSESFSEASRQLRISVSSVSKQIAMLEEGMGVPLLLRTTRSVTVTEAGREFYRRCLLILDTMDKATTAKVSGHVRISAPPSVSSAILNPNVAQFLTSQPDVTVDFFVTSAVPDVVRHRIDAAIVLREWPGVKLNHRKLGVMRRTLCASPKYLAAYGIPTKEADLARHKCLMSLLTGEPEPWTATTNGRKRQLPVKATMSSDNGDLIREACVSGAGIANLYEFHARERLRSGSLVGVLPDVEIEPVGLYAIMPHKDMVNQATLSFLDFFQAVIKTYGE